ncbi:hypothetical protein MMC21_000359 [Puttea exsequens]|nr:hypothetical protein [Puttea exsequens]
MTRIYDLLGAPTPFDPFDRYTTSWLLPPLALSILRALFSLYAFVTIFIIFGYNDTHNAAWQTRHFFSYFTDLNYCGLAFYSLFAAAHTFSYWRRGRSWLQGWGRPAQVAHAVLYTTVVTFSFLVTVVFWVVLYNGLWFARTEQGWSNISQHALNSLFALFELILPRTSPPPPLHVVFLIIVLALYLALAYITHATAGWYPYSFLDPKRGAAHLAGFIVGILVAACVIFGIVWVITWARVKLTERLGFQGKFAKNRMDESEGLEDGQQVIESREELKHSG